MQNILIVEDNTELRQELAGILKINNYHVYCSGSGSEALSILKSENVSLVLLDNMLPDCRGFDLCEQIRTFYKNTVIFLTVCDKEDDIITGFDKGGDDYVTKPFSGRLLLSRIQAHLRRKELQDAENVLYSGDLQIEFDSCKIFRGGAEIQLRKIEFDICEILIRNAGKIVKRDILLDQIWDSKNKFIEDNTLNVHISRLRRQLQCSDGMNYIETIKGFGYRWGVEINGK